MLNPSASKGTTYADRPMTPLGEATGITSTPVSEAPSRGNTPRPDPAPNPYHYQPAITSYRPELTALRRNSSNYAQAQAESILKLTTTQQESSAAVTSPASYGAIQSPSSPHGPRRSYSFSAEDLKRSSYQHLMSADADDKVKEKDGKPPLRSPGIGNSELMGHEYGFTSTG
jgi:hypothetical protein